MSNPQLTQLLDHRGQPIRSADTEPQSDIGLSGFFISDSDSEEWQVDSSESALYLASGVIASCVDVIVRSAVQARLRVIDIEGEEVPNPDIPFSLDQPIPRKSQVYFLSKLLQDILVYGNVYMKVPAPGTFGLEVISPQHIDLRDVSRGRYLDVRTETEYSDIEIHHAYRANPVRQHSGISPIRPIEKALGIGTEYDKFLLRYFISSCILGGVVKTQYTPQQIDQNARRIAEEFRQMHAGARQHRLTVLGKDTEFDPIAVDLRGMLAEQIERKVETAAIRAYGIPRTLIETHNPVGGGLNSDQFRTKRRQFWEMVVSYHLSFIQSELQMRYGNGEHYQLPPGQRFDFDVSGVPALQNNRAEVLEWALPLWERGLITSEGLGEELNMSLENVQPPSQSEQPPASQPNPDDVL